MKFNLDCYFAGFLFCQHKVKGGLRSCRTLTYTLVPLVVLNVALRAAAAETTQHVLTSVLASVVPCALVHV